jgi:hypothetical protein
MIDGVDAGDGIEAGIGEGQLCGRVGNLKSSALGQSALRRERVGCCNCLFMNASTPTTARPVRFAILSTGPPDPQAMSRQGLARKKD